MSKNITHTQLIHYISDNSNLTYKQAQKALNSVLKGLHKAIVENDRVALKGLGVFIKRQVEEKTTFDKFSLEDRTVPAHEYVSFVVHDNLRNQTKKLQKPEPVNTQKLFAEPNEISDYQKIQADIIRLKKESEMLTPSEAAKELGMPLRSIYHRINGNDLSTVQIKHGKLTRCLINKEHLYQVFEPKKAKKK